MEQDGQLAGHRDTGAAMGSRAPSRLEALAEAAQVTVLAKGSHQVVSTLHQMGSEQGVALFADPQLRTTLTRLPPGGHETEIGPDISATTEAAGILQDEDEGQGGNRSHTPDLS